MKTFLRLLAAGFLALSTSESNAQVQSRTNTLEIVGTNGTMVLSYTGNTNGTFTFPEGSSTVVPQGTLAGQTLAWDGTEWSAMSNLLNSGGNLTLLSGNLSLSNGTFSSISDAGVAAEIDITNAGNGNIALDVSTAGTGPGARIVSTSGTGLVVTSTSGVGISATSTSASAITGTSTTQTGVSGVSTNSTGVSGTSTDGNGVAGVSSNSYGVLGQSTNSVAARFSIVGALNNNTALEVATVGGGMGLSSTAVSGSGVHGQSTSSAGVYGVSSSSYGLRGVSTSGYGVHGTSNTSTAALFEITNAANNNNALEAQTAGGGAAIVGTATSGTGISGVSTDGSAVRGLSTNNYGVYAESTNGTAAYFSGSTAAIEVAAGSMIGSTGLIASGGTLPSNVMTVLVQDDGTIGLATAFVPASGTNGQIMFVGTDDGDGLSIGGSSVGSDQVITLIYIGGSWKVGP